MEKRLDRSGLEVASPQKGCLESSRRMGPGRGAQLSTHKYDF
jgi:hypothetical protein